MKPWPDKSEFFGIPDGRENYERARAEAAIERLKAAEKTLKFLVINPDPGSHRFLAASTLEQIGDIP